MGSGVQGTEVKGQGENEEGVVAWLTCIGYWSDDVEDFLKSGVKERFCRTRSTQQIKR